MKSFKRLSTIFGYYIDEDEQLQGFTDEDMQAIAALPEVIEAARRAHAMLLVVRVLLRGRVSTFDQLTNDEFFGLERALAKLEVKS